MQAMRRIQNHRHRTHVGLLLPRELVDAARALECELFGGEDLRLENSAFKNQSLAEPSFSEQSSHS